MSFRTHLYRINLLFSSNPEILFSLINSTELHTTNIFCGNILLRIRDNLKAYSPVDVEEACTEDTSFIKRNVP